MPRLTHVRAVRAEDGPDMRRQPAAQGLDPSDNDGVTREEMVKLFGSALRVR